MLRSSPLLIALGIAGAAVLVARHFSLAYAEAWLTTANACAFLIFLADKGLAAGSQLRSKRKSARRVPESALVSSALFGGAAGAVAAMVVGRHKTKKWGIAPFIVLLILQAAAYWYWTRAGSQS